MFVASLLLVFSSPAFAFNLHVIDAQTGLPIADGYRWMVEEDNTFEVVPQLPVTNALSFNIHNSYTAIAMLTGGTAARGPATGTATVELAAPGERYYVSVLPDANYANSGAQVPANATDVYVMVNQLPLPTAQISVFAFVDHNPINNAPDDPLLEPGIGGATIIISDGAGPLWQDAFANPLGTTYQRNPDGSFILDGDGVPVVAAFGNGVLTTWSQADIDAGKPNPENLQIGEQVIKYLSPGKYGIVVVPPTDGKEYILTSTIEGTPTVDAWIQANESKFFIEQFGAAAPWHAFYGFVIPAELPWATTPPAGTGSISGQNRFNHFSRPPVNMTFDVGPPVGECWVGLNDAINGQGLYAAPCDDNSNFAISNVPDGAYELVTWDTPLDALFGFHPVTIPDTLGNRNIDKTWLSFRWFGTLKGNIFLDSNENGFRDPGEVGLQDQAINLRYRDGTIYQATVSDPSGEYELTEVFPFFKWLVVEVDFARFKATGMTAAVDQGGTIPPANGWFVPSFDVLNPQPQTTDGTFTGPPIFNPLTGNNLSRNETGPVLTEAMLLFLNQTNVIDWGKNLYGPGPDSIQATLDDENGGISGVIIYAVTRAENEPQWAAAEEWEPGIPNVQVVLYHDDFDNSTGALGGDGVIDCFDANGAFDLACSQGGGSYRLADIDSAPLNWHPDFQFLDEAGTVPNPIWTGVPGPEDTDRNSDDIFNYGDAVAVAWSDSWNDSKPSGCIQALAVVHGAPVPECGDAYGTWNQIRPGIFDGGYAFNDHYEKGAEAGILAGDSPIPLQSGTYIVEANTPFGYDLLKEEDKNVDFGDTFIPSQKLIPAACVGDPHLVPAELTLFPGVAVDPTLANTTRPLCDRKQLVVTSAKNAAADFHFFTPVPKAARGVGFSNNDLAAEFDTTSPAFGEKGSPSWLPVSFRDWYGNEVGRTYTDEFGSYEIMLPGTYTVNQASPSGVTLSMINILLNDPFMMDGNNPLVPRVADLNHDPNYSVTPWTFQFETARTSYIDSPVVPVGAFVGYPPGGVDVQPATGVPVVASVQGANGGALVCAPGTGGAASNMTLTSLGTVSVQNPNYDPNDPVNFPPTIPRDFGFGAVSGSVLIGGSPLKIVSWANDTVVVQLPVGVTSGELTLFRGDNGMASDNTLSVAVGGCGATTHYVAATGGDFSTIQAAIDAANPGDTILVAPGTYDENVILYKEVTLQGSGDVSYINARTSTSSRLDDWRAAMTALGIPFEAANEAPGIFVSGSVAGSAFAPGEPHAKIDGFQITGSTTGGGIFVNDHARDLEISNTQISGNQGVWGGGITVGLADTGAAPLDVANFDINIHDNRIRNNASVRGAGGISLYVGSDNYVIADNQITANLSRWRGGGILHEGLSDGGLIVANKITFNEVFYAVGQGGDGGGVFIAGEIDPANPADLGAGTGSVTIDANLIQGNLTGSGNGGGIRVFKSNLDAIAIYNNLIVNNVAAYEAGGISLQDADNVTMINNTVARNDSTSTAQRAFENTILNPSTPHAAGIVAGAHTAALALAAGRAFPDPVLQNNIIWQNRSYFYKPSLNGGTGGLIGNPTFWDLEITGTGNPLDQMNPSNSILTSLTGADGENYSGNGNQAVNPSFAVPYTNAIVTASIIDEGGNAITVRYTPLNTGAGDYHLRNNSAAIDAGAAVVAPELAADIDAQARPTGLAPDVGADEVGSVTVTAPNGGETLFSGIPANISWSAAPSAASYKLFYSLNNGANWQLIGTVGNVNNAVWTVPDVPFAKTNALVKVNALNGNGTFIGFDVSDATFTIAPAPAQLTAPNGGETVATNDVVNITWYTHPSAVNYRLHYSIDNGANWSLIRFNTGNVDNWNWTVPTVVTDQTQSLIRLRAYNSVGQKISDDVTDNVFTITP
jgi:parallel beta-helix repeat protein